MICLNETPETLITQGDLQRRIDFSGCTSQRLNHQRTCRFLQRTLSRYMHQCGSVSRVSPRAKMTQDILLRSIQLSRYLSVEHKLIVDPVIQRNAYFAYPENLLLSMTTEIVSIYANWKFVAFLKVLSSSRTSVVRHFKVPKLRFNAHEVYYLIDWQNSHIT